MKSFLWPTSPKVGLFTVFMLIAIVGSIQATYFSLDEDYGSLSLLEKWFRQLPIWDMWVILISPLELLVNFDVGINQTSATNFLFWCSQIAYFYLLSCLLVLILQVILGGIKVVKNN